MEPFSPGSLQYQLTLTTDKKRLDIPWRSTILNVGQIAYSKLEKNNSNSD